MYRKYICPIIINYNEKYSIEILPNVNLSKMSEEDKMTYFNIMEDEYGMNNIYVTTNDPMQPNINDYGFRLACNHKLIIPKAIFKQVLITLMLYKTSNFGIKYIRGDEYKDFDRIPNCLYIPNLTIFKADIPNIRKIYSQVALYLKDKFFIKIMDSYKRILSFSELTPDEKFRDLVVILEKLYLQGEDHNIKKKLSSRIAEYFHIFYAKNYDDVYIFVREAYSIRSNIAHYGESNLDFENSDNNQFLKLLNITRLSILLYLEHIYAFDSNTLKQIPIKDNHISSSQS